MIALIQRVSRASVYVENRRIAHIQQGILVLLGVEKRDTLESVRKIVHKLLNYRIFTDYKDKMNLNVQAINGQVLLVPQFTLAADTSRGMRAGFSSAAPPERGLELFTQVVDIMRQQGETINKTFPANWLQTGQFGADMAVELVNDGPVTFYLQV